MRRVRYIGTALLSSMLAFQLAACGAASSAQTEEATPTPLPPAAEIERPTFVVKRGTIENPLDVNGRVSPVDLKALAFKRAGTVASVHADKGQQVKAGDVLAELKQDDEVDALREAEDGVTQAQRDLDSAKVQRDKQIAQAKLDLQDAQDALKRVLPGGADDPIRAAQKELEEAQKAADTQNTTGSEGKTEAEYNLVKASEALSDTQKQVSAAYWDVVWVDKYGTDPDNPFTETTDENGKIIRKPNKLTDEQKQAIKDKYTEAQRTLRDSERAVAQAERALEKARKEEIDGNGDATEKVAEAQNKLNDMISGSGNKELSSAQKAVKSAQLALEEAEAATLNTATKAVEDAKRALDKARKKVTDGQITAPQDGELISISIGEGDTVEADSFVIEIADTSRLEVGAELGAEQMRQLQEGQPAEITLLSRPDVVMPASIRQMPEPYGSGSSGNVESKDRRTLFEIADFKGLELKSGQNVKIRIVLESKENALWLPPDAVRSFEGRRFVVVRTDQGDRRQTVKVGIETQDQVEITEGVEEGDVIVGQ
ncbi:HlyD family efflux transporter periplasmic adaptor subunit [Chloroflexia bacterium SDU3-3]|nr:HlyD family efflux transporter periplasmic adaptor subunit [Chloroflexia bacterium SDU3-3]